MKNIPDFPSFQSPNYGIKMLGSPDEKLRVFKDLEKFWRLIPFQPFFFISRNNWNKLAEGSNIDLTNAQKAPGRPHHLKVYGYSFCFAITDPDFLPDLKYYHKYGSFLNQKGFFRVRTILIKDGQTIPTAGEIETFVETESIAFVDVSIAMNNLFHGKREDCLVFIDRKNNPRAVNAVDRSVYDKNDPLASRLPGSFYRYNQHYSNPGLPLAYEGCIFSKERIWDDLLNRQYPHVEGVLVSLAAKEEKDRGRLVSRKIYFDFKINQEGISDVDCPFPPACH
ncbi:MAG: hypothetical protein KF870_18125 [Leadbetterella sp.]|nr:hypothetical protein [Leadbetterella sp.]